MASWKALLTSSFVSLSLKSRGIGIWTASYILVIGPCLHAAGVNAVIWYHPGEPLSRSHISVKMMILRLFFGPRSARQAALKGPQLPEMFWVPQGRGWDAFPNSQGSLLSIAPMQTVPRLSALDFIYSFIYSANFIKKQLFSSFSKEGLPWWCKGYASTCWCRGHGLDPCCGNMPHATEHLSPRAQLLEPADLEPVLHNEKPQQWEAHALQRGAAPLPTTGESPHKATEDSGKPKINQ